jgi:hypothetical protein
LAAN